MPSKNRKRDIDKGSKLLPAEGSLRIWHIPNVPNNGFHFSVTSVNEAKLVLTAIAEYDLHLGEDVISSNAQGLEVFKDGEWEEWEDDNGYSITEVMDGNAEEDEG